MEAEELNFKIKMTSEIIDAIADRVIEKTKETKDFYTIKDVAKIVRMHHKTVFKHVQDGILEAVQVGGTILIKHEELIRYTNEKKQPKNSRR